MTHEEAIEWFACRVCGKPAGLDPDECHTTVGRQNPLCREHEGCRIKEKSEAQLEYARTSTSQNTFLKACPGSGKTEVVGLKAAYEIKNWEREVGGIAVLTFTNHATDVIRERVCQFAGIERAGYPHYIGTIDSWLHGYVAHPSAHFVTQYKSSSGDHSIRIVDSSSKAAFLHNYKAHYSLSQTGNPSANQYYWDAETSVYVFASEDRSLDKKRNDSSLADWQLTDLRQTKERFYGAGFATYQDVENICLNLLSAIGGLAAKLAK